MDRRTIVDLVIIVAAGYFTVSNCITLAAAAGFGWEPLHYALLVITILLAAVTVWKTVLLVRGLLQKRKDVLEEREKEPPPITVDSSLWEKAGLDNAEPAPGDLNSGDDS